MNLDKFERYPLMFGPSPIHPLKRLSKHFGGPEIWAKRDDCNSGLAYGGNKVRKLEYLVPDALRKGVTLSCRSEAYSPTIRDRSLRSPHTWDSKPISCRSTGWIGPTWGTTAWATSN